MNIHNHRIPPTEQQLIAYLDAAIKDMPDEDQARKIWIGLDKEGLFRKLAKDLWLTKKKRQGSDDEVIEAIAIRIRLAALEAELVFAQTI